MKARRLGTFRITVPLTDIHAVNMATDNVVATLVGPDGARIVTRTAIYDRTAKSIILQGVVPGTARAGRYDVTEVLVTRRGQKVRVDVPADCGITVEF